MSVKDLEVATASIIEGNRKRVVSKPPDNFRVIALLILDECECTIRFGSQLSTRKIQEVVLEVALVKKKNRFINSISTLSIIVKKILWFHLFVHTSPSS
jgi:hypothetical protein